MDDTYINRENVVMLPKKRAEQLTDRPIPLVLDNAPGVKTLWLGYRQLQLLCWWDEFVPWVTRRAAAISGSGITGCPAS